MTYVFTHDSVALGEDGPTHQPIEHLASLRAMPGLVVIRPSDANETAVAWRAALERRDGPTALVLSRQNLPVLDRKALGHAEGLLKGAYILKDVPCGIPSVILVGTGSEVHIALEAAQKLADHGVGARVVAMPSWELFRAQSAAYREKVLPAKIKARVAVEAASTFGWERVVGDLGIVVGIDRFGASAPAGVLFEKFGLTVDRVVESALQIIE